MCSSDLYWTMDGQWYDPTNPEAYYASQQQQQQEQQQQQGFVEGNHYASSQPLATARDAVRHAVDAHNIAATSSIGASYEYGYDYSAGASAAAPLTARDAVRQSASLLGGLNVPRGLVDAQEQQQQQQQQQQQRGVTPLTARDTEIGRAHV